MKNGSQVLCKIAVDRVDYFLLIFLGISKYMICKDNKKRGVEMLSTIYPLSTSRQSVWESRLLSTLTQRRPSHG